ncbi:death-on-curing protein [Leptolyngbya sp. BL0902]|uniref:type II toxin-antitoxin system death-on-curing family toxin n=1 Tax=Leptolyngbya sp. BL0902 TaxID=1115757 RepID=UPI0018E8DFD8|nr:type II toxin-antitoxin system death-on-curing family toxin [Leptolyngbya sp. BL0902]QQE65342.1 death-on-curing protein [Leptolyngbya sp. BL0902]
MQTPKFLTIEAVLRLHDRQIERFGGTAGLRDQGLLDSALAQPQATFGGEWLHPTLADQAAAYLYHLSRNHPFVDGNKRTAFAVMMTFLRVNGYRLTLTDDDAYDLVMQVAQRQVEKDALAARLAAALVPTED